MSVRLIIVGLRRSGTTIFWNTLRQDQRLAAYDEPFNPWLQTLPQVGGGPIKHPGAFHDLLEADAGAFWETFAPIGRAEELRRGLSDTQAAYLHWLGERAEHVMMDVTRCHFKVEALKAVCPDAMLVHLYRPAPSLATSHLLPSAPTRTAKLKQKVMRMDFWTRAGNFDGWSFERIMGARDGGPFALRMRELGMDPAEIYALPAVGKLMAYWRVFVTEIERRGREVFGERFLSIDFEQWCSDPQVELERVYRVLGWDQPEFDLSAVHPANRPFQEEDSRWADLAARAGVPLSGLPSLSGPPARV